MSISSVERMEICKSALIKFGALNQIYKCDEELIELRIEINRHLKGHTSKDDLDALRGELADVFIMISQLAILFDLELSDIVLDRKLKRLKGLIKHLPDGDNLTVIKQKIADLTANFAYSIGDRR